MTRVQLRSEHFPGGSRHLVVFALADGGLRIEGQDLGAGTEPVSDDGEYEWSYSILAQDVPELRRRLGVDAGEDLLEQLERRFAGAASYEFERLTQGLRRGFSSWC